MGVSVEAGWEAAGVRRTEDKELARLWDLAASGLQGKGEREGRKKKRQMTKFGVRV